jgi:alpha-tubulin suppressor-like RCC1 family protein
MPAEIEGIAGVTAIACSSSHSALIAGDRLHMYGSNQHGQLGLDADASSTPAPVILRAPDGYHPRALQVSLGARHSAALSEGGALWTWGDGGSYWWGAGALGQGNYDSLGEPALVERFVELGEEVIQVACGAEHTVVLTEGGHVYTCGKGSFGRLGRGETSDTIDFELIEYFGQSNDSVLNPSESTAIIKVGAGENFSAAMSADGELWLWGRNDYGQIGLGEEAMEYKGSGSRYPRMLRGLALEGQQIVDFACGRHHVVALTSAGAIYEVGNRVAFEPRSVTLPSRYKEGLKNVVRLAAGDHCSFAVTGDGSLYSWGAKASRCLLQGNCEEVVQFPRLVPSEVFAGKRVIDVAAAENRCLAITAGE